MVRWEPNASGRLREAAMELFVERGYDQTTVADIAERAGLTARTFFRYFADKREVLFNGSEILQERMVAAVESAPPGASPLEAIGAALAASAELLGDNRAYSRRRDTIVSANAELRERELIKMARLAVALEDALVARGVPAAEASLTAEAGVAVFRVSFRRWVTGGDDEADLAAVMEESLDQLRSLAAGGPAPQG